MLLLHSALPHVQLVTAAGHRHCFAIRRQLDSLSHQSCFDIYTDIHSILHAKSRSESIPWFEIQIGELYSFGGINAYSYILNKLKRYFIVLVEIQNSILQITFYFILKMERVCTLTHFIDFVDIQNSILQITFLFISI